MSRSFSLLRPGDEKALPGVRIIGAKQMKFILMMNGTKADFDSYAKWPKQDLQASVSFMRTFGKQLREEGVLVAAEGLAFADQARIVRAGSHGEPVTDGVFPESKEFLAGY